MRRYPRGWDLGACSRVCCRLKAMEDQRDDARSAHTAVVEAYKELQSFVDALQCVRGIPFFFFAHSFFVLLLT